MTPAIEALERVGADYELLPYEHHAHERGSDAHPGYGREAADALGLSADQVFKTLMIALGDGELAVAVVPVSSQLSLKAAAQALGAKRATMADVAKAERATGYVAGGISPFGQKRLFPTVVDETVELFDTVYVSGGRRGLDIGVSPAVLIDVLDARVADIAAR